MHHKYVFNILRWFAQKEILIYPYIFIIMGKWSVVLKFNQIGIHTFSVDFLSNVIIFFFINSCSSKLHPSVTKAVSTAFRG